MDLDKVIKDFEEQYSNNESDKLLKQILIH